MYVADRLKSELSLGIDSSSDLGVHDFQHLTGIPANWSLFVSPPSSPTRNEFEFFTAAYSHILWYPEQIFINTILLSSLRKQRPCTGIVSIFYKLHKARRPPKCERSACCRVKSNVYTIQRKRQKLLIKKSTRFVS